MNNQFVPYGIALQLKELEFDEPCFGYWVLDTEKETEIDCLLKLINLLKEKNNPKPSQTND
jgi:hypothetical protein